ncbi:MAG: hypothetical protein AMS26_21025 [Bacteroides sp. SM23_62]|nr:MAG: hypothetical protein AMS26_21025 [Bacteroides sp. SM23_62]
MWYMKYGPQLIKFAFFLVKNPFYWTLYSYLCFSNMILKQNPEIVFRKFHLDRRFSLHVTSA